MTSDDSSTTDQKLARFWRLRPVLLVAFAIVTVLTVFFGARTMVHYADWQAHKVETSQIRPWMRPTYIARTFGVDRQVIYEALDIDPGEPEQRLSLAQIARTRGEPLPRLIMAVETAISESTGRDLR